jgi:hypothetical protein
MTFVLMAAIVAALIVGVIYLEGVANGPTTTDFSGDDMQQTFDDLRGAIRDNTR